MNLQVEFDASDVIPANAQNISLPDFFHIFVNFLENELSKKFYGIFDHFSGTYKVTKFWLIKLCLDVRDIINSKEHMWYSNCGLHVNIVFL